MMRTQVEFILARKLIAISANVFFPTTILNIISFSTNYYKNDYFESIVGINLTSMLVLTALIVQVLGTDICKHFSIMNIVTHDDLIRRLDIISGE